MEIRCARCQGRQTGTCQQCHLEILDIVDRQIKAGIADPAIIFLRNFTECLRLQPIGSSHVPRAKEVQGLGWCTLCQQEKEECDVCSGPIPLITDPEAGGVRSYAQRLQSKEMKGARVVSLNMHHLGKSFVEKVNDVRRRATGDGKAVAPGESLEFLAHICGWQAEARRQRRDQMLQLSDIGLRVALENAAGADIFFIPEVHFAKETPGLEDDEGWGYQVRSVIWCRECRKCGVRKEREGFEWNEWTREQSAICTRCNMGSGAKRASSGMTRKVRKRVKNSPNPQARRPRAAHGKGVAVRDATSGSDEDEAEGVDWGTCQYGVIMSPAHPWYVGRGDHESNGMGSHARRE